MVPLLPEGKLADGPCVALSPGTVLARTYDHLWRLKRYRAGEGSAVQQIGLNPERWVKVKRAGRGPASAGPFFCRPIRRYYGMTDLPDRTEVMSQGGTMPEPSTAVAKTTEDWLANQTGVQIAEHEGKRLISIAPTLAQKVNLLTPISQVQQLDTNYSPSPRLVQLGEGDIYKEKGKPALTAKGLSKLAELAQIEHIDTRFDDMGGTGVRVTVVGRRRGPDGHWQLKKSTKTVRFDALERKVRRESDGKSEDFILKRIDEEMEHVDAKAETKAWNRVVRSFLAVKGTYSEAEIKKPFLCVSYQFTPDYGNKHVVELMRLNYSEARSDLGLPAAGDTHGDVIDMDDTHAIAAAEDVGEPTEDEPEPDFADADGLDWDDDTGEVLTGEVEGPAKPESGFTIKSGPYEGQSVEEVVSTRTGVRWLADAALKLKGAKRQQAVDWLSLAEGMLLGEADLRALAEEVE
jgi:hypothetical protein